MLMNLSSKLKDNRIIIIYTFICCSTLFAACEKTYPSFTITTQFLQDTAATNLAVVWQDFFYEDSAFADMETYIYLSDNHVAFYCDMVSGSDFTNKIGVNLYHKETGEKHPRWNDILELDHYSDWDIYDNYLFFCDNKDIKCYDINTKTEKWSIHNGNFEFRFDIFWNKIYTSISTTQKTDLITVDLETGAIEKIFTAYTTEDYETSFESYVGWIAPWGDSIIAFQNRQYNFIAGGGKVDIYAYNLSADSMLWTIEDITPDGNSSIFESIVVGNKLYFQGSYSQHCINITNGEIIWELEESGYNHFLRTGNMYADGKIFIRTEKYVAAYCVYTDKLLWEDNSSGLVRKTNIEYYQGKIYFTGADEKDYSSRGAVEYRLFCLDANTGSLIWKSNWVDDFELGYQYTDNEFRSGIVIDQSTGYLYTTDNHRVFCIDLNRTPISEQ